MKDTVKIHEKCIFYRGHYNSVFVESIKKPHNINTHVTCSPFSWYRFTRQMILFFLTITKAEKIVQAHLVNTWTAKTPPTTSNPLCNNQIFSNAISATAHTNSCVTFNQDCGMTNHLLLR